MILNYSYVAPLFFFTGAVAGALFASYANAFFDRFSAFFTRTASASLTHDIHLLIALLTYRPSSIAHSISFITSSGLSGFFKHFLMPQKFIRKDLSSVV
jgi:hypothetical protein